MSHFLRGVNTPAGLILAGFTIGCILGITVALLILLPRSRRRFEKRSRSVLKGLINEQMAPYLPGFPYNPSDATFIGKPIDMLIFEGLSEGRVDRIVLLEIKSGKHKRLTGNERMIRDAIADGRIEFHLFEAGD